MTHRDPEAEQIPVDIRRAHSRPYEIAALLACTALAVALGLHRRAEAPPREPPPMVEPAPAPVG